MGEVRIEAATVADAGELLTVQRAAYVTEAQRYGTPFLPPLVETHEEVVEALADGGCLKAVAGGRLVGGVRVVVDGETARVGRLVVAPDRQGRGIGGALLDRVHAEPPPGVTRFELFTGAHSDDTIALYRRRGYREIRRERDAAGVEVVVLERPA